MVVAKKYIYAKPFSGMPTVENFQLATEELPTLSNGGELIMKLLLYLHLKLKLFLLQLEYLAEAIYWSMDPYTRLNPGSVGDTMIGTQVAK